MTPERWKQVEELYHAALELAPDQRTAFLTEACAADHALREEVETLMKAHSEGGAFLAAPALEIAAKATAAPQSAPLPGQHISHYEILSLLGVGGMGEVYLACDRRLDRKAALKILPPHVAADPDRTQRFVIEAKAASALNHPNVATIYDVGQADGSSFIAMEYVEGQTLAARIGAHPLSLTEVVTIGIQIADALAEAHSKGITHRDIKPANIMLTPREQVKVLDFGLAKITRTDETGVSSTIPTLADTQPGLVMGTAQYMSPEQVLGHKVDHRSDIFSLGVVLYEMATGRPPFAGKTATDTMGRILHVQQEAISRINEQAPPELERIIHKCLEKDPERRYSSAHELLVDLENLEHDSGSRVVVAEHAVRQRWSPRRRVVFAVVFVVMLLMGAASLFVLVTGKWGTGQAIESVAVLPVANTAEDPEMEYLADGLTENMISTLSQLWPQLKVESRSSVFRYKGRDVEPQTVGRELGVQAVLAGRILLRGDQLAVSVELIDVSDNRQIWGEQYNRKPADLLHLPPEILREVSDKLGLRLSGPDQEQLARRPTTNPEAYQLFLKARFFQNRGTEEGFKKAIGYYQQALEKDPNYALAHVGVADAYIALGADSMAPREVMPIAKKYAMEAIKLDEALAEAHSSLGIIHLAYDWDWPAAEKEFRRNLSLTPPTAESFSCSLHWEDPMGRNDEAIASIKRALALDPSSLLANLELGCASYYGRHYDESIKQLREALNMYPDHPYLIALIGRVYGQKKMYSESIAELTKAKAISGDWPPVTAELGYAWGASGKKAGALETIAELRRQATRRFVDPYLVAMVHMSIGEKEQTFAELDKAYAARSGWLPWLNVEPKWDSLHSDPRFTDLLRRVGLTP